MQTLMNFIGLFLLIIGLADFFISKQRLEKLSAALKDFISSIERNISINNGLRIFLESDYVIMAPVCVFIVIFSFFSNFDGNINSTIREMKNGFAGPILYFFLPIFVGIPLSILIINITLKSLLRYLIWCPKGVTSLFTLPLACWILYKKISELMMP